VSCWTRITLYEFSQPITNVDVFIHHMIVFFSEGHAVDNFIITVLKVKLKSDHRCKLFLFSPTSDSITFRPYIFNLTFQYFVTSSGLICVYSGGTNWKWKSVISEIEIRVYDFSCAHITVINFCAAVLITVLIFAVLHARYDKCTCTITLVLCFTYIFSRSKRAASKKTNNKRQQKTTNKH